MHRIVRGGSGRELAERQGGRLEIAGDVGRGTTVTVTLPRNS
ncbi:MAG: hypothetical protein ACOC2V_05460 [Alkalispirochaeta sp.]